MQSLLCLKVTFYFVQTSIPTESFEATSCVTAVVVKNDHVDDVTQNDDGDEQSQRGQSCDVIRSTKTNVCHYLVSIDLKKWVILQRILLS